MSITVVDLTRFGLTVQGARWVIMLVPSKVSERHETPQTPVILRAHEIVSVELLPGGGSRLVVILNIGSEDKLEFSANPTTKSLQNADSVGHPRPCSVDVLNWVCIWILDKIVFLGEFDRVVVVERPAENPGHLSRGDDGAKVNMEG